MVVVVVVVADVMSDLFATWLNHITSVRKVAVHKNRTDEAPTAAASAVLPRHQPGGRPVVPGRAPAVAEAQSLSCGVSDEVAAILSQHVSGRAAV